MIKTDRSIHNICIAAIKRHTIEPFDFRWTRYYEEKEDFLGRYIYLLPDLHDAELPICSTIIDAANWSVLTTRRLFTKKADEVTVADIQNCRIRSLGNFNYKGHRRLGRTLGTLRLADHSTMRFHIETGRASMVMIYGVRTRRSLQIGDLPFEPAAVEVF